MSLDKEQRYQEAFNPIGYFKRYGVLVKELKEILATIKGDLVIDLAPSQTGLHQPAFSTKVPNDLPGLRCTQVAG